MGDYSAGEQAFDARGLRVATVVARFNEHVTGLLAQGAAATLARHGVPAEHAPVYWVPGAFELPVVAKRLASSGEFDAVVCLGAVIRGDTPHFDFIAAESAAGVARVALDTGIPVVFGVLTTDNLEQALERCGGSEGHKGAEAAATALETAALLRTLPRPSGSPSSSEAATAAPTSARPFPSPKA
jgi:6,7-dimethyl-8-ribityllumazine synthase